MTYSPSLSSDLGVSKRSDALAWSMADAASLKAPSEDVDTVLGRLAEAALRTVHDVDVVSISLATRDAIRTKAATDPLARQLDELQYDLQEGPCIDALLDPDKAPVADGHQDLR